MKACSALGLKIRLQDCAQTKITLHRISGSLIPDVDVNGQTWTIGRYIEHAFSMRSRPNIGVHVAVLDEVTLFLCHHCFTNTGCCSWKILHRAWFVCA